VTSQGHGDKKRQDREGHRFTYKVSLSLLDGRTEQEFYRDMCLRGHADYEGLLTPTGKPKKKPWFCVTFCPSCEVVGYTYARQPLALRFRCREYRYHKMEGVLQCEQVVTPIEPIGMTEGEMFEVYDAWREKYG